MGPLAPLGRSPDAARPTVTGARVRQSDRGREAGASGPGSGFRESRGVTGRRGPPKPWPTTVFGRGCAEAGSSAHDGPLPAGCDDAAPKRDVVGQARYSGGYSWPAASSQLKPPVFSVSVLNHQLVSLSALAAHHFRRDWLHLDSSCQNRLCIRVPCRCINTAELPLRHALEPTDRRLQQERCPASI